MPALPGSPSFLKGAFVRYDGFFTPPKVIVFPYNPATLSRTIQPAPVAPGPLAGVGPAGPPVETIVFTLQLDATGQAGQTVSPGVYPVMSAIELLMYTPPGVINPLTLFVWGANRILPVRVAGLQIVERLFDPELNPIQVTAQVTLNVLSAVDPADIGPALALFQEHVAMLNTLAGSAYTQGFTQLGITPPIV